MQSRSLNTLPITVSGTVVEGKRRGRQLGFPTANLSLHGGAWPQLFPGVYAGRVTLAKRTYPAMASFGSADTFDDPEVRLEAHLIGYTGDLYGRELTLELIAYLRPMQKFITAADLAAAMRQDRNRTLEFLGIIARGGNVV